MKQRLQNLRAMSARVLPAGFGVVALISSGAASAAVDVAALVTEMEGNKTPIGLVGMASLGLVVAIAAFVWIRKAMRG